MGFPYRRIGSSPTNAGVDGGAFNKFDNYFRCNKRIIWDFSPSIAKGFIY